MLLDHFGCGRGLFRVAELVRVNLQQHNRLGRFRSRDRSEQEPPRAEARAVSRVRTGMNLLNRDDSEGRAWSVNHRPKHGDLGVGADDVVDRFCRGAALRVPDGQLNRHAQVRVLGLSVAEEFVVGELASRIQSRSWATMGGFSWASESIGRSAFQASSGAEGGELPCPAPTGAATGGPLEYPTAATHSEDEGTGADARLEVTGHLLAGARAQVPPRLQVDAVADEPHAAVPEEQRSPRRCADCSAASSICRPRRTRTTGRSASRCAGSGAGGSSDAAPMKMGAWLLTLRRVHAQAGGVGRVRVGRSAGLKNTKTSSSGLIRPLLPSASSRSLKNAVLLVPSVMSFKVTVVFK